MLSQNESKIISGLQPREVQSEDSQEIKVNNNMNVKLSPLLVF